MNRSSNYVLDMLQEEDDDDMEPFTSLKDFGTTSLAEFNSLDKLEAGHSSAREREHGNSGFLRIQPCQLPSLSDKQSIQHIEEEK